MTMMLGMGAVSWTVTVARFLGGRGAWIRGEVARPPPAGAGVVVVPVCGALGGCVTVTVDAAESLTCPAEPQPASSANVAAAVPAATAPDRCLALPRASRCATCPPVPGAQPTLVGVVRAVAHPTRYVTAGGSERES